MQNIHLLEKQMLEKQSAIDFSLSDRESIVGSLTHQVDLKNKQVLSLQSQLEHQTQLLEQAEKLKIQLETRGSEIRQLNRQINNKDDEIVSLRQNIAQNQLFMSKQTQEIKSLESSLALKNSEYTQLQQKINMIAIAKTRQDLEQIFNADELGVMQADFEQFDSTLRTEREQFQKIKLVNLEMQ